MKRFPVVFLVLLSVILIVTGVWIYKQIVTTPDQIRVGYMNIVAHLPLVAANEGSMFSDFLLDVKLDKYPDTPTLMQALVDDRIDVAFQVTPDVAWRSATGGRNYYVYFVAQSTREAPIDGLYALEDMDQEALKDSVIGVFPGPTAAAMMKSIMAEAYDLQQDRYTLRAIPPPLQLSLLGNREIAALFTYEPLGTLAVERAGAKRILKGPVEEYVVNPWNGGVGIFGERIVKYRPEVACNFSAAIARAVEELEGDPKKASELMSKLQPGLSAQIAAAVPLTKYFFAANKAIPDSLTADPGELDLLLQDQLAVYLRLGILSESGRLPILSVCKG